MSTDLALPIEWLPEQGSAEQLIVLLHGWRGQPMDLAPLAQALRIQFPQSAVLVPEAPNPGDPKGVAEVGEAPVPAEPGQPPRPRGRQWYSLVGLDPQRNWHARVGAAVEGLRPWLRAQQRRLGVGPAATALGGFSQGAIVALETVIQDDGIAGRVLAFAGCLVAEPAAAPRHTTVHLFHGGADRVIPADGSRRALERIGELQGDATLDIAQGIGHEVHPALIDCALHRLTHHIPMRTWQAALGAVPRPD